MNITGVHISYYFLCKRKLWLFAHSIQMEKENENVAIGKLISETTYERKKHEIEVEDELERLGIKIDFFDKQTNTIHEIKKSDSFEIAHTFQLLFYIYVLKQRGVENLKGMIDYPKLKKRIDVEFSQQKENEMKNILEDIQRLIKLNEPLTVKEANIKLSVCKKCSYYELCYS